MSGPAFTFTSSPASTPGRLISSSSQDSNTGSAPTDSQQNSATSPEPRTSPSPSGLFQNLNIHGVSTYADLHSATPRLRPRRVTASHRSPLPRGLRSASASHGTGLNAGGLFGAFREPVAESTSSGDGTERPPTPATGAEEEGNEINASPPSRMSVHVENNTYNFRQEPLPLAPIYDSHLQDGLVDVKNQLGDLANTMRLSERVRDPNTSLHALYKEARKASEFKCPETRTVGLIGASGVGMLSFLAWLAYSNAGIGKSSVINSLLDQMGLARSVMTAKSLFQ